MRTKPVTRDELLAMAARAQAQPIADHYPGKRTAKGAWKALREQQHGNVLIFTPALHVLRSIRQPRPSRTWRA